MPSTDGNIRSTMDSDTIVYAKVVWCWVQAIMDNTTFDVVEEFRKASLGLDDVRKADIAGAWEVVRAVTALPSDAGNSFANIDKSTPHESAGCWDAFRDSKCVDQSWRLLMTTYDSRSIISYIRQFLDSISINTRSLVTKIDISCPR